MLRKVAPPSMPEYPLWMIDWWLGPSGQEWGELGLMRSAARKFACQINSGLCMASQVRGCEDSLGNP
jgi:hypothetical protein